MEERKNSKVRKNEKKAGGAETDLNIKVIIPF